MTDPNTIALNDKITAALAKLDHTNNDHWTDDGLPRTGVVQKLAGDQTIRRQDINSASPGFARITDEPAEVTGTGAPAPADAVSLASGGGVDGGTEFAPPQANADEGTGLGPAATQADAAAEEAEMTVADVRAALDQNIVDAQANLEAARTDISDAHKRETEAMQVLKNAQRERATRFPPLTPSQNIKSYINAENERRVREAHARGVYGATAQVDRAAVQGNSRGWKRPTRPAIGVDGVMVQPATRQNKRVLLPSQGTRGAA